MVLKGDNTVLVGVQRHRLRLCVHEPRRRDGFLRNLIHAGEQILQDALAVHAGLDLAVAVCRLYLKDSVGHGLAGISILFMDDEIGPLLVLQGDHAGFAGEQLHMVLPQVQNVILQSVGLHNGIDPRI